jgi:hypothetical protein
MNLTESICKFLERNKDKFERQKDNNLEMQPAGKEGEISSHEPIPRDGMSLESAKLAIGRCANNSEYEIHGIKNEGRYFTAKIMDSKGRQVNQLLVDKLSGRVRFLR